jgi:recombination protein RecA
MKKKTDDARLEQIKKAMGVSDDSVRLADQHVAIKGVISSGMAELDRIMTPLVYQETGKGGLPLGFVAEFFGPYAGGKTSLAMKFMADVTQKGEYGVWIDAEGSYVPEWAALHGVDNSRVVLVDNIGRTGESLLEQTEQAAASGKVSLIVVDSVTALTPKQIQETSLEDEARVGAGAKMMTRAMPRMINAAKKGGSAIIFINQIRQKIGIVYGNPETTPYGEALKFYCSLRLRLSQVGSKSERGIMKGEEEIGIRANVQIVKSRFGPPYRETIMPIYFSNTKPHPLDMIIDAALSEKIVKSRSKKKSNGEIVQTFSFEDIKTEGIDEFKQALSEAHIKSMFAGAEASKITFNNDVKEYLASLDDNDPANPKKAVAVPEGDPGE